MKYFNRIYNSFLLSMTISLILFTSEWLEMRVNVGIMLIIIWALLSLLMLTVYRKSSMGLGFTISNFIICFVISMALYGSQRLMTVPASIIREGIGITNIPFTTINTFLITWLVLGMIVVIIGQLVKNKKG